MQTKMVAKYIDSTYRCTKCKFKFTTRGGVYDNSEFIDKIQQKANKEGNICISCRKGVLELTSVMCRVDPIINRNYYEIKWECKKCNTQWCSIENLNPRKSSFIDSLDRIKNSKACINESCSSYDVKAIALTYHRKI